MKTHLFFLFSLLSAVTAGFCQDLSGVWKGTLTQQSGGCFPQYFIELQLTAAGDSIGGASYHYSDISHYVKKKHAGTFNPITRKLVLQEGPVQTFKIPADCIPCIKNYELWYSRNGNQETLRGIWRGKVMNSELNCQPGQLVLSRVQQSAFRDIPEVEVDSGTIRLDFYDNGIIDDDTISVYANNRLILSKERLSARPSTTWLRIDPETPFQEIEMVAENLGRIPPNTALLIVTAGTQRYRLQLTSTHQKSARVRFIYEPALSQPKTI